MTIAALWISLFGCAYGWQPGYYSGIRDYPTRCYNINDSRLSYAPPFGKVMCNVVSGCEGKGSRQW